MKRKRKIRRLLAAAALVGAGLGCHGDSRTAPAALEPARESIEPAPDSIEPLSVPVEPTRHALAQAEPLAIENAAYAEAADYSARHGGLALVVIEGDRVALAIGQNGHRVDEAHPLHGASESFWGPLAVAAEREEALDLDERVASTLHEWKGVRWKDEMRIRHLLEYTSGLESGVWPLLREEPANHYERALTLHMVAAPGERFQYGPSHLAVFGEVLRRKLAPTGSDALAYLERRILDPIGLEIAGWERDAAGNPDLANGAKMAAGEWAKFGVLIRDRGEWRGAIVLDAKDVETCLEPGSVQPRFGLTLWLDAGEPGATGSTAADRGGREEVVMAAGAGNQRLYVIPSLDLVVARFGEDDRGWRDPDFLDRVRGAVAADH